MSPTVSPTELRREGVKAGDPRPHAGGASGASAGAAEVGVTALRVVPSRPAKIGAAVEPVSPVGAKLC